MSDVVPSGMPIPGVDPNGATESIAVSGNTSNSFNSMSGDQLQERINDARQQGGGFGGIGPRLRLGTPFHGHGTEVRAQERTYTEALTGETVWTYHASLDGLRPDTQYVFEVLHDGATPVPGHVPHGPARALWRVPLHELRRPGHSCAGGHGARQHAQRRVHRPGR